MNSKEVSLIVQGPVGSGKSALLLLIEDTLAVR